MTTRAAIVKEAREWLGTPWQHQACLKGIATDCLGLIGGVGVNTGVEGCDKWPYDIRMRNYVRAPSVRLIRTACDEYLDRVPLLADVTLADILWMTFSPNTHFAIVVSLNPMCIIHGHKAGSKVVETGLGGGWDQRVVRAYRYRGVE